MFERLKNWFKGGLQKMAANTGIAREFKDIFEIGGVPAFNQFYYFGIFVWKYLYRGFYNVWHLVPAPTIQNPQHKRQMYRMDMAKAAMDLGRNLTHSMNADTASIAAPTP